MVYECLRLVNSSATGGYERLVDKDEDEEDERMKRMRMQRARRGMR